MNILITFLVGLGALVIVITGYALTSYAFDWLENKSFRLYLVALSILLVCCAFYLGNNILAE